MERFPRCHESKTGENNMRKFLTVLLFVIAFNVAARAQELSLGCDVPDVGAGCSAINAGDQAFLTDCQSTASDVMNLCVADSAPGGAGDMLTSRQNPTPNRQEFCDNTAYNWCFGPAGNDHRQQWINHLNRHCGSNWYPLDRCVLDWQSWGQQCLTNVYFACYPPNPYN